MEITNLRKTILINALYVELENEKIYLNNLMIKARKGKVDETHRKCEFDTMKCIKEIETMIFELQNGN